MAKLETEESSRRRPLRLWPGLAAVALQWLAWVGGPIVVPGTAGGYVAVLGGLLGGLAVAVWWAFFSRAARFERWGAVVVIAVALPATYGLLDESIATGMMGLMFAIYAVPVSSLAFVGWATAARGLPAGARHATMVATILAAVGAWTLLRSDGITGGGSAEFAWRWSETAEQRLLARTGEAAAAPAVQPAAEGAEPAWPGFRGARRDAVVRGVRIATDWSASPPVELWRRPVGPGWSSFAVQGEFVYTQEQRGDDELVSCYNLRTGEPVWRHSDDARFWEANAGAGPRATPTLNAGRVYAFGATGIFNALDARDGALVWSRNAAADAEAEIPGWGFAGSPLIVADLVVVAVGGRLVAYDLATGEPRWFGPDGGHGYSSPHRSTIDGVAQVVLLSGAGAVGVAPGDGKPLWEHPWPPSARIVQPALTADGDLLISGGESSGLRRLAVAHGPSGWTVNERWTSIRLKPYFNDFVVHKGHAYGFDGRILTCIDIEDGERKWKGGRYGQGQLLLLADQDLLLVLSEQGDLALVPAAPDRFAELARFPAIEGKTWNHPALAGDILLIRNGEEMAAFRLDLAGD